MTEIKEFRTGSRRGYCPVKEEGVESEFHRVLETIKGLRGNLRKAMELFIEGDCKYYTVSKHQYYSSNKYHYYVRHGYKRR